MPRLPKRRPRVDPLETWARTHRKRRLEVARETLARERAALPLFADQVQELQPSPAQRLREVDRDLRRQRADRHSHERGCYEVALRLLRHHSVAERRAFAARWRSWQGPRTGLHFLNRVRALLVDASNPGAARERQRRRAFARGTHCG